MSGDRTPIVQALVALIDAHGWRGRFAVAVEQLKAQAVPELAAIQSVDAFLDFLDALVTWAPREAHNSQLVHDKLVAFHFLFDQPALKSLQDVAVSATELPPLTPLSAWIVAFADAWGQYLDSPQSAAHVDSFRANPTFRWNDYMPPPSGYRTFNQFFARHAKPGLRPIDAPGDSRVLVAAADAVFIGQWAIDATSTIDVEHAQLPLKGLHWSLKQLLAGSPYAGRFAGGVLTHSALRTFDYHRFHAPVAGDVVESRVIQGRAWLDVDVEDAEVNGVPVRRLRAREGTGYQFTQTRGLVVLRTAYGLVAWLPVGMAQVSSVMLTAEVGVTLRKGEELGYFQFGGSDLVLVFEAACGAVLETPPGLHVAQGRRTGVLAGR